MNGWVSTSVCNRLGETQFRFFQSDCSVVQKALQAFFQYCKEQPSDAALGCSSFQFSAGWEQSPDHGHSTRESFRPQLHLRQTVPACGGERKKRHRIKTHCWEHCMTNSVCDHCQRHDLEGLTAHRESHSNPDRAVKQVIDVIQYFPKNLVLVCGLLSF